jgi:hypothetical protein
MAHLIEPESKTGPVGYVRASLRLHVAAGHQGAFTLSAK